MASPIFVAVERVRRTRQRLLTRLRAEDGFTLIELLTVMAMLGIVFTAAFFFYSTTLARTGETQARRNTLADQRIALERIAREIREAQTVDSPTAGAGADTIQLTVLDAAGATSRATIDCSAKTSCTETVGAGAPQLLIDELQPADSSIFTVGEGGDYVFVEIQSLPEGRTRPIVLSQGVALRNCAQDPSAELDCRA